MYYEAKSVNTQLIYRHKRLEREKDSLEAAWSAHKRLHSDAGLDLSDTDTRSLQTSDVSSSVSQSAACSVRQRSHSAPEPLRSMRTDLLSEPRCLATSRQVPRCGEVASNASSIAVQGRTVSDAAFERPSYCELADGWTTKRVGGEQPASPDEPSSPLYCIEETRRSAVSEPSSTAFDADRRSVDVSTSPAIVDEDDLDSLFGGDEWWASDQSWRWQCGSPDERTQSTSIASTSPPTSADSFSTVDLLPVNNAAGGHFGQHETFIPLHVACLLSDSCSQCEETSL